jgi:hypothetical protein
VSDVPEYAAQPPKRFLEYWEDSRRLLEVSIEGMSALKEVPAVIGKLNNLAGAIRAASPNFKNVSKEGQSSLSNKTVRDAEFCMKEIKAGFPLLHAHTLVGAWGALEAAIEDMLVGILMNEPKHLQHASFSRIKIPLAEFEAMEREDRMRLLIEEIHRPSNQKNGVDAFESILEAFFLSGPINADIRQDIWEMNHVRNVIVHRNSTADRRLVKSCPSLGLKVGDKVVITTAQLDRYGHALCEYVSTLLRRLENRYKEDIESVPER